MDELLIPVFVLLCVTVPLLALALILYAVPVRASVRLILKDGHQKETFVISWCGVGIRSSHTEAGLVIDVLAANHPVISHTVPVKSESGKDVQAPDQPAPSAMTLDTGEIVHRIQALLGPAGTFGSAVWRECRFEEARGRITLGLGDPVLTGECCGLYWASRFILEASRIYLELEPVFDRQVLELDITARMKVRHPLLILVAALRLARDAAVRDAMVNLKRQSPGVPAA